MCKSNIRGNLYFVLSEECDIYIIAKPMLTLAITVEFMHSKLLIDILKLFSVDFHDVFTVQHIEVAIYGVYF